jgi:malate dehydrogenase (oxaloacetate-decarboxylating)(NADP+)
MGLDEDALDYHRRDPPGKVAIETTKPTSTQRDLSLAYSPGVARRAVRIAVHPGPVSRGASWLRRHPLTHE